METPHTDHLTASDYEHVYEPAEDSFLLLDALEADLTYLERLEPCVCLEIGSGSGIIITALAQKLQNALCLATDINGRACNITKRTAIRNRAALDCINCNLADALRMHTVDLLLFNPPYVVTTDEELRRCTFGETQLKSETCQELVYAWAGGTHGRRIIDELLLKLDEILSPRGVLYLLLLRENKPDELIEKLRDLGFKAIKYMERRIPGEYLFILKVKRE